MADPTEPALVQSRDNPLLVRLRKLSRDPAAYRKQGELWLEGEHRCSALRQRGGLAGQAVVSESAWRQPAPRELARRAPRVAVVPGGAFYADGSNRNTLGLSCSCASEAQIDEGIARIGRLLRG